MTHFVPVIKGLATYIPGLYPMLAKRAAGKADNAEYCYDTWFKHLTFLWDNGLRSMPETLAEFGPGNSLGLGLAALLSGVNHYYAFDIVKYETPAQSMAVFDRLVELFQRRAGRIGVHSPNFDQYLDERLFPSHILTEARLEAALQPERIAAIRQALLSRTPSHGPVTIQYVVPWNDPSIIQPGSVDVIISHAVMQHVDDLENTYSTCAAWLKPRGWMSHQIDFRSHKLTSEWNGHWTYSDAVWNIIVGKRPYLLNRQPCSTHLALMETYGFNVLCSIKTRRTDGISRDQLASTWQSMSDDDLTCSDLFVQAQKR